MLNEKNLILAGWLSVVLALLAFPSIIIGIISGIAQEKNPILDYLTALLNIGYTVVYVYVMVIFKRLLNQKASFYDVDKYIIFSIWLNILITIISIIALPFTQLEEIMGILSVVILIPFGVIFTVFAIKLLNCDDNLFGYLKPFSYLTIASGIMIATVILLPFGLITSIISDIILAIIFFKASKTYRNTSKISRR